MGYERNPRGGNRPGDYYNRGRDQDYGRDYGSGRDYSSTSARDYAASQYGDRDSGRDREQQGGRDYYGGGRDDYGSQDRYGSRDSYGARDSYGSGEYGSRDDHGSDTRYGRGYRRDHGSSSGTRGGYGGSYASDGRRFAESSRGQDDDRGQRGRYAGQPQGYDYEDRGFFDRAGDEVRSWFGDDEAERRRDADRRFDERGAGANDEHYDNWRRKQMSELDRDYHEYRQENRSKFENEFNSFRTERQTQRSSLSQVKEHMEVVGSDGEHVGTVDKVRGDRIVLTKSDKDAGGRHHSIPSRWIDSVDDKVKIRKTAEEAQSQWRDEERNQAMFGDQESRQGYGNSGATTANSSGTQASSDTGSTNLNRSFSGTYRQPGE
jgi:hypothetical protein